VRIKAYNVYAELKGQGGSVNTSQDYLGNIPSQFVKDLGDGNTLVDLWEQEFKFRVNPDGLSPVIWSCGENKVDDTNFEDYFIDNETGKYDYTPPDRPAMCAEGANFENKYPRVYYYLGDGTSRRDDIGSL
jgi:hypothetical protein